MPGGPSRRLVEGFANLSVGAGGGTDLGPAGADVKPAKEREIPRSAGRARGGRVCPKRRNRAKRRSVESARFS